MTVKLDEKQRMPPKVKKVVVDTDFLDAEKLLPNRGYRAFKLGLRRNE
jgi:hypothetical protein